MSDDESDDDDDDDDDVVVVVVIVVAEKQEQEVSKFHLTESVHAASGEAHRLWCEQSRSVLAKVLNVAEHILCTLMPRSTLGKTHTTS